MQLSVPRIHIAKKMLFFLAFNSHFYLSIIRIAIQRTRYTTEFHTNYFLLHIFSLWYFLSLTQVCIFAFLIFFCPFYILHNIIFHSFALKCREIDTHIIVIVINNIMGPYGTQLCFILTRTHNKRKKCSPKFYEVRYYIENYQMTTTTKWNCVELCHQYRIELFLPRT